MLFSIFPPTANAWASDYSSIIISSERLYSQWISERTPLARPHPRTQPPVAGQTNLASRIVCEGQFNLRSLNTLIIHGNAPEDYHPDQDLQALNIISWHGINAPAWGGTRVGKMFFPPDGPSQTIPAGGTGVIYDLKTGFFTSMRPADGQLLLNVSTTTSAFNLGDQENSILLQHWIECRWNLRNGNLPSNGLEDFSELKGLKVTFLLSVTPNRQWSVYGVSSAVTVSRQAFRRDS